MRFPLPAGSIGRGVLRVLRVGGRRIAGQIRDGVVHHLGYLPPDRVVALPEVVARAWLSRFSTTVPRQHLVAVGRLDELVERAATCYVVEVGGRRVDQR